MLSLIALALWFCSLPFTGLTLYSQQQHLLGYEILMAGWLSPLMLNFAWFANVFFLYAVYRMLIGKTPTISAVLATLLSLDTLRCTEILLDEGGGASSVYGYGWGAVLWFFSIFMMLFAVGNRRSETNPSNQGLRKRYWVQSLGLILILCTLVATSYFAVNDRIVASPTETQRLSRIAFKRGEICSALDPVVTSPIRVIHGSVEIVQGKSVLMAIYPFSQVKQLLSWGIPVVRIGGNDYSFESTAQGELLTSIPATGAPAATLFISEDDQRSISAKLVENGTNRTVFEQLWKREAYPAERAYYCPDYKSFPGISDQPRKLIMQALTLRAAQSTERDPGWDADESVEGVIIWKNNSENTQKIKGNRERESSASDKGGIIQYSALNTNCPTGVGWNGENHDSTLNVGLPFIVNGKSYFLGGGGRLRALCEGEHAYVYMTSSRGGNYYLKIQKRNLRDFQREWSVFVAISDIDLSSGADSLKVTSIRKEPGSIAFELASEFSGQAFLIQAPLIEN